MVGVLDIANCSGGAATVSATTIDWLPPGIGAGKGCIDTGIPTAVHYGPGFALTLGPGVAGDIQDLVIGGGAVPDFMTFVNGADLLHFDLAGIGPGVVNTVCAATLDPNLPACSVTTGSAFILTPLASGTVVQLSAFGTAHDSASPGLSNWSGQFSTTLTGQTPAEIAGIIGGGGSISSTFSGHFDLTTVPEPVSMALIGGGLMALALLRRRSRRV
jgi:hypothetical protein